MLFPLPELGMVDHETDVYVLVQQRRSVQSPQSRAFLRLTFPSRPKADMLSILVECSARRLLNHPTTGLSGFPPSQWSLCPTCAFLTGSADYTMFTFKKSSAPFIQEATADDHVKQPERSGYES